MRPIRYSLPSVWTNQKQKGFYFTGSTFSVQQWLHYFYDSFKFELYFNLSHLFYRANKLHCLAPNNSLNANAWSHFFRSIVTEKKDKYGRTQAVNRTQSVLRVCENMIILGLVSPNAPAHRREFQHLRRCEAKVCLRGPAPKHTSSWPMCCSANHTTDTTVFPALSTNQKCQNTKKRELQLVSKTEGEGDQHMAVIFLKLK